MYMWESVFKPLMCVFECTYTSVDAASALEISTQYGTARNKFICPNHAPI